MSVIRSQSQWLVSAEMAKSSRELNVCQRAIELTTCVYQLTAEFPKSEMYGLTSQMRRAAVSIASNIAEGSGRSGKKEFRHFLSLARGSNCELQTQLIITAELKMADQDHIQKAISISHEVGRMFNGLTKSLLPPTTEY